MACLEIFTFLFFFSFLPHLASTTCRGKCSSDGPAVRFPFWLRHHHSSHCGWLGFNLSCNNQKQAILTLPSSGDFIVDNINYLDQILTINDPNNCLIKRFLEDEMDLMPLPFSYLHDFANYTFFNCSPKAKQLDWYPTLSCLSSDNYKVTAVPTTHLLHAVPVTTPPSTSSPQAPSPSDPCSVISTAMIPIEPKNYHPEPSNPSEWEDINFGVQLRWDEPDCRYCESVNKACGIVQTGIEGPEFGCQNGSSRAAKIATVIGVVMSGVLWLVGLALRLTRNDSREQSTAELSILTIDEQLPVGGMGGLDHATIDSYPKTQLGESRELPYSGDNTCPICLGEYQAKETIRSIPECNHYFHANCVDKWLRRNPTCPLCRNPPEGGRDKPLIN
ncbi:putative RING-H2 finger protein ATL21A [Rosa sericea]